MWVHRFSLEGNRPLEHDSTLLLCAPVELLELKAIDTSLILELSELMSPRPSTHVVSALNGVVHIISVYTGILYDPHSQDRDR